MISPGRFKIATRITVRMCTNLSWDLERISLSVQKIRLSHKAAKKAPKKAVRYVKKFPNEAIPKMSSMGTPDERHYSMQFTDGDANSGPL
jgi:hypothetical protein